MPQIRFLPEDRHCTLDEPILVSEAAADCDILIEHPCGGKGQCSKCRIRFREGAPDPSPADRSQLNEDLLRQGWRLACQTILRRDAVIEVPPAGRALSAKSFGPEDLFAHEPPEPQICVRPFALAKPTLEYQWSHLEALEHALGLSQPDPQLSTAGRSRTRRRLRASASVIRSLGTLLTALGRRGEATLDGDRLIALAAKGLHHGIAVDVGSTTLAVGLTDLVTGRILAAQAALNPQVRYGSDVVARIQFANENPEGNARLHDTLIRALSLLIEEVCEEAGVNPGEVVAATFCGNAVMTHTLVGADVRTLGTSPYVGAFTRDLDLRARDLALPIHPEASVWVFPQVRSNVGGDAVAAALAIDMDRAQTPCLMIDLGTNSEILLGCRDWMIGTSTAAGPAFEGHNISNGMRAAPGAVDRVSLTAGGHVHARVLGGPVPARGICGSGLIDAVAMLLDAGVIDPSGRMIRKEEYDQLKISSLKERLTTTGHERPAIALTHPGDSLDHQPVLLNDLDVRALQLVKGSIRAGAEILLKEAGIAPSDLGAIHLAGAFGNYLRKTSVMRIGLTPEVEAERVLFAGNAAGIGARLALVDARGRRRASHIAEHCRYVELSAHPDYTEAFAEGMAFPEPLNNEKS